jgi:hypothetical protein
VAHLRQPAQLHIDRHKQHCLTLKVSNTSSRHPRTCSSVPLPRPQTHPSAASHHEPSTQQEMNPDPTMRGRQSRAELEHAQQRMAMLRSRRILLISGGINSGNHHWNSTSVACAPASRCVNRLHMPWPLLFYFEPVPTPRACLPAKQGRRLPLSVYSHSSGHFLTLFFMVFFQIS